MSVLDLSSRYTHDWDLYNKNLSSNDSCIHISPIDAFERDGPSSMNITVGDEFYDCTTEKYIKIGDAGCKLATNKSIIIKTTQNIALPLNVFGLVVGTGKNIYRGAFISAGKINPGFHGELRIGIFNGGKNTFIFKPGDLLGSCVFSRVSREKA